MKFFVAKQVNTAGNLEFKDVKIMIAKTNEEAIEKYNDTDEGDVDQSYTLICKEVKEGVISFNVPVDKFVVKYPDSVKSITVHSVADDTIISGYLIAEIPAMASLKEEEILEYMYRGNIERYNNTILAAQNDERIRLSLRRLRQAIPFHRLVIDTGIKNVIVPINSNYVVEE